MFARNTIVGTVVFAVDIMILWALVDLGRISTLIAATIGFVVASTLHYAAGRKWIFTGSDRPIATGYFYFIINAGIGLLITIAMLAIFLRWTSINYLVARVIVSLFAGLVTFLLNAVLIFPETSIYVEMG